jgi:hypothetical protein
MPGLDTYQRRSFVQSSAGAVPRADESDDFSLILGGPLFQLLRRTHLSGSGLELVRPRVLVFMAVVWLPLLAASLVGGQARGDGTYVPFLLDVETHVRFLVALPLLILAEVPVHNRMRSVVRQFMARHLIPEEASSRFEGFVASAYRLRNSVVSEVALIAIVYVVGVTWIWRHYVALTTATWYGAPATDGWTLSRAGVWYGYVSLPIFQFLLVRWYYRIFIWSRFLFQVSRLPLSLIPTHPDRVGGLGFLGNITYAFAPLALAHGAITAGPIAGRIFHLGAALPDFKAEVALVVLFVLGLVYGPLLAMVPRLAAAKRVGLSEYGTLAERYVREFDTKWLRGAAPAEEALLGSADIQSLADLGNSFEIVKEMRFVPITRDAVLRIVAATVAPIVPLLLTMMSLEDLIRKLFGILF